MLQEYTATLTKNHKPRTVVFLITEEKVLLGYKKNGFGKGNYVGVGGKVDKNETIEEGTLRELKEEINVNVDSHSLKKVAVLRFYFPHVKDESWNQEVHAYLVTKWEGEPSETDEIEPLWFEKDDIPLDKMWDDAKYWFPKILSGEEVYEEYLFNKNLKVIEH